MTLSPKTCYFALTSSDYAASPFRGAGSCWALAGGGGGCGGCGDALTLLASHLDFCAPSVTAETASGGHRGCGCGRLAAGGVSFGAGCLRAYHGYDHHAHHVYGFHRCERGDGRW